jgi:hypothetical protein
MKQLLKSFFCITLLMATVVLADCGCSSSSNSCNTGCNSCGITTNQVVPVTTSSCEEDCDSCVGLCKTTFVPRSPGSDLILQWQPGVHKYDMCEFSGTVDFAFQYQRSFDADRITRCLFGTDTLTFQGSTLTGTSRAAGALLADNFGLARDFNGTLTIKPRIDYFTFNFGGWFGLDEWLAGLYLHLNFPVVHTRWKLDLCETGTSTTAYPPCYFGTTAVTPTPTIIDALSGTFTGGELQSQWCFGQWRSCQQTKTGVANFIIDLGWDFWSCEDYHVGLFFRTMAPTDNRTKSEFFFEPLVGDAKHWKVGGGLTAHWELWNCDDNQSITAYLDGYAVHAFRSHQTRSFEFINQSCCLSRYMLLKQYDSFGNFTGNLVPGINFTTRNVDVKFDVEGEAALQFIYRHGCWSGAVGYDIWGRSREKICLNTEQNEECANQCITFDPTKQYGFKGCEGVCTFSYLTVGIPPAEAIATTSFTTVPLPTTESLATICSCTGPDNPLPHIVGNALVSYANTTPITVGTLVSTLSLAATTTAPVLFTVNTPNLNIRSAESPSQISHTVFGHIDYTWSDCDWTPYVQVGGEGSFGQKDKCCTLNKWAVWIKGGVSF